MLLFFYACGFASSSRTVTLTIDICCGFGLMISALQISLQYFLRMAIYVGSENLIS